MIATLPLQFGIPGGPELLIILFIAVLLFGANKLPGLARASGEAMGEFKRGRQELEDELKHGVNGETNNAIADADERQEIDTEFEHEQPEQPKETDPIS